MAKGYNIAHMAYKRDGRAPVPHDPRVSATMSRIRAKNTRPEMIVRAALRRAGHTGYRLHYDRVPGRPDIAFVGRRIALFVHGCFWHGCPHCTPGRPKNNRIFWDRKLDANKARDQRKAAALRKDGWAVYTVWECALRRDPKRALARVVSALSKGKAHVRSL
jgi:DNA mismatch endonuclease (patch repair protein)